MAVKAGDSLGATTACCADGNVTVSARFVDLGDLGLVAGSLLASCSASHLIIWAFESPAGGPLSATATGATAGPSADSSAGLIDVFRAVFNLVASGAAICCSAFARSRLPSAGLIDVDRAVFNLLASGTAICCSAFARLLSVLAGSQFVVTGCRALRAWIVDVRRVDIGDRVLCSFAVFLCSLTGFTEPGLFLVCPRLPTEGSGTGLPTAGAVLVSK